MIGKWHLASDPTGFDYWNILPGQGVYYDPVFIDRGEKKKHHGLLHGPDRRFQPRLAQEARPEEAVLPDVPPQGAAPLRGSPRRSTRKLFDGQTIPEPDNLLRPLRGHARAAWPPCKMQVGENSTKADLKVDRPAGLEGDALRKWAYQHYIKDYLRCMQSVDDNVGRLLDYLDAEGLAKNTIVIYTSDQGFFLGDHGWFDKRFMYEESLRMPFLIRYPGAHQARLGEQRHGAQRRFRAHVPGLRRARRRPPTCRAAASASNLEGHTPEGLAHLDVLPLLDAQRQRPPRARALRRAHQRSTS